MPCVPAAYYYAPTGLSNRFNRSRLYPSDSSEMASPTASEAPAGGSPSSSEKGAWVLGANRPAHACLKNVRCGLAPSPPPAPPPLPPAALPLTLTHSLHLTSLSHQHYV